MRKQTKSKIGVIRSGHDSRIKNMAESTDKRLFTKEAGAVTEDKTISTPSNKPVKTLYWA